jgi:hypothetical protein
MPIGLAVSPVDAHSRKNKIPDVKHTNLVNFGCPASPKGPHWAIRVNKQYVPINQVSVSEAAFFSLSEGPRGLGLQVYESLRIRASDI